MSTASKGGEWRDSEWETLIRRIETGRCTPFLGAGVAHGLLPLGSEVAARMAKEHNYPFDDRTNLIRVSQYVALNYDTMYVKEALAEMVKGAKLPEYKEHRDEPHRLLARLPLPVYVTTNYDDLMFQALGERKLRNPVRDLCRWTERMARGPSTLPDGYSPSVAEPLVFHLHGHAQVLESLVVTEDDYLEFLGNISRRTDIIPRRVEASLAETALLFIGYQLADWNFRVILRGFGRPGYTNIAVMPRPGGDDGAATHAQDYLTKYYGNLQIRMYWGTAQQFLRELIERAGDRFD